MSDDVQSYEAVQPMHQLPLEMAARQESVSAMHEAVTAMRQHVPLIKLSL